MLTMLSLVGAASGLWWAFFYTLGFCMGVFTAGD